MHRVKGEERGKQEGSLKEAEFENPIHPGGHCKEPSFYSQGKVSYQEFEQKSDMI